MTFRRTGVPKLSRQHPFGDAQARDEGKLGGDIGINACSRTMKPGEIKAASPVVREEQNSADSSTSCILVRHLPHLEHDSSSSEVASHFFLVCTLEYFIVHLTFVRGVNEKKIRLLATEHPDVETTAFPVVLEKHFSEQHRPNRYHLDEEKRGVIVSSRS
ncbi:hypothetical protein ALC53_01974 [Atta colombica]|uniref:Uncharacterized protein n=1 Tax=Atta colombica TaxID=520822 RepID=A0A195BRJ7_9HYME|nr:hypothetical protein ALC53_01974 [Atta colombica]